MVEWVGIDFGTSYSSAALVVENRPVLVREPMTSNDFFPTCVLWHPKKGLLAAAAAERYKKVHPDCFAEEFKRNFGECAPLSLGDKTLPITQAVTAVLSVLKGQAEKANGGHPIPNALITVPASYARPRRDAVQAAATAAGFERVELLSEPVAAAIYASGPLVPTGSGPRRVLIYDFGGGTFDAALLHRVGPESWRVIAHSGLADCGGKDIDRLIQGRLRKDASPALLERLDRPLFGDDEHRTEDLDTLRLRSEVVEKCRAMKRELGTIDDAFFDIGTPPQRFALERNEFETLLAPLIERTLECCATLLRDNDLDWTDLSTILMVGGSSRIPLVENLLRKRSTLAPEHIHSVPQPELAVAQGAALLADARADRPTPPTDMRCTVDWVESIRTSDGLTALAVAANAPVAVSGGTDGVLRMWNLLDGRSSGSVPIHAGLVSTLAISRTGMLVACGNSDGTVRVWRPATDTLATMVLGHGGWVNAVRLDEGSGNDEDAVVYSVGDDGRLRVARADGRIVEPSDLPVGTGRATACAVARGGVSRAASDSGGSIRCISTSHEQAESVLSAGCHVWALDFDPAGQLLAAACDDGVVRVWNPPQPQPVTEWPSRAGAVRDVRFGPSGLLASGHTDGTVRVWDRQRRDHGEVVGTHGATVRAIAFPSEVLVVSAGADAHIRLWRLGRPISNAKRGCQPRDSAIQEA